MNGNNNALIKKGSKGYILMKKFVKTISAFMALTLALLTISCNTGSVTYKTDVKTKDIYTALEKIIKTDEDLYIHTKDESATYENAENVGVGTLKYRLKLDESLISDCFICNTGGNSCFEYGVFNAGSAENATKIKTAVEAYITACKNDSLALSYSPEDLKILEKSKCVIIGNYVVYTILEESTADTLITRVTDMLTQK